MKGHQTYRGEKAAHFLLRHESMTHNQFESLKSQLQHLTPQQLRLLQGEIKHSLENESNNLLTDDELNVLSSFFS
ncbi:hypothetical protein LL266_16580 [Vibrio anguillarum]|uniref:hypothetical protein n=1 Tax=Vibrio anguillarum TaxID=55601 RepID=UPI001D18E0B2|nr:hypothetical protein [Vibrio anguillarum]MCC4238108.1 hypothetical protein [Vibrio anguillarum]